jgi:hypothetical protein
MSLERPNNYEEAKIILKNTVGSELDKKSNKAMRNRAIFNTAASLSVAGIAGVITGSAITALCALPLTGLVLATSIIPIVLKHTINKKIENGKLFEEKSKKEIIDMANNYVTQVNDYEASHNKMR